MTDEISARAAYASAVLWDIAAQRINDALISGAIANELRIDWRAPTVTLRDGLIVVTENFRFI